MGAFSNKDIVGVDIYSLPTQLKLARVASYTKSIVTLETIMKRLNEDRVSTLKSYISTEGQYTESAPNE
jgi:hypothetical protein